MSFSFRGPKVTGTLFGLEHRLQRYDTSAGVNVHPVNGDRVRRYGIQDKSSAAVGCGMVRGAPVAYCLAGGDAVFFHREPCVGHTHDIAKAIEEGKAARVAEGGRGVARVLFR